MMSASRSLRWSIIWGIIRRIFLSSTARECSKERANPTTSPNTRTSSDKIFAEVAESAELLGLSETDSD